MNLRISSVKREPLCLGLNVLMSTLCVISMGIILCMLRANERRYNVTRSLIGWAHAQKDPCVSIEEWYEEDTFTTLYSVVKQVSVHLQRQYAWTCLAEPSH